VPGNITVTEIKRMSADEDAFSIFDDVHLREPEFVTGVSKISGAQMGTLVHLVMEKLEFKDYTNEEDVSAEIRKLCDSGIISEKEYEALNISAIYHFFKSELGRAMINNNSTLVREFSFKYLMNASEVFELDNDDKMIVQGTVDAYFTDSDGQIVVVDYKTDKVGKGGAGDIASRYKIQLEQYSMALEYMTEKKVKARYLYLFDTGETVAV